MRGRNPYARRLPSDRPPLLDRILWTREEHPIAERVLIAIIVALFAVEGSYQIWLAIARAVAYHAPIVGP
jgi:hypothetical protein